MPDSKQSYDLLEISQKGRELAAGAIEIQPAHYYGTAEINESLQSVLKGKSPEVSKAVYTLIQSNMLPDGSVSDEQERDALLEMGLSQAKFLADKYLTGEESSEFLSTIQQIAAIAKTRTVDPETGQATYVTPYEKPKGAPDDYVSTGELMKRFEPKTYEQLSDAIRSGGDWGNILIQFALRANNNEEWKTRFKEENGKLVNDLRNTKIENRFAGVDTSSMKAFVKDMSNQIQRTSFSNTEFLTRNMQDFTHILGWRN
ncbi:hypothetical protein J7E73_20085 [Paenibacillus albidus]|uniref:hypothetical protein n=1 Tax=Paenibacillus albidus TaxID=2041023 RepID=UPI001BE620FC|nr:hypothetical protein [Paenibacillus albidus]MBT2291379.1 hypothetical protein [Paenibacillus albidus]